MGPQANRHKFMLRGLAAVAMSREIPRGAKGLRTRRAVFLTGPLCAYVCPSSAWALRGREVHDLGHQRAGGRGH